MFKLAAYLGAEMPNAGYWINAIRRCNLAEYEGHLILMHNCLKS